MRGFIELITKQSGIKTLIAVKDISAIQPALTGTEVIFTPVGMQKAQFRESYELVKQYVEEAGGTS